MRRMLVRGLWGQINLELLRKILPVELLVPPDVQGDHPPDEPLLQQLAEARVVDPAAVAVDLEAGHFGELMSASASTAASASRQPAPLRRRRPSCPSRDPGSESERRGRKTLADPVVVEVGANPLPDTLYRPSPTRYRHTASRPVTAARFGEVFRISGFPGCPNGETRHTMDAGQ